MRADPDPRDGYCGVPILRSTRPPLVPDPVRIGTIPFSAERPWPHSAIGSIPTVRSTTIELHRYNPVDKAMAKWRDETRRCACAELEHRWEYCPLAVNDHRSRSTCRSGCLANKRFVTPRSHWKSEHPKARAG